MSDVETPKPKELSWEDAKCDLSTEYKIKRKVSKGEYELVYRDMTGDEFEQFTLGMRAKHKTDEKAFNIELQRELRKRIIISVMGKKYDPLQEREMQPWLIDDLNSFIMDYLKGNLV